MAVSKIGRREKPAMEEAWPDVPDDGKVMVVQAEVTPEQAAEVLMEYLPAYAQERIREASSDMARPLWQMLLGYVNRVAEMQQLYNPFILDGWQTYNKPTGPRICKGCGLMFTSRWPDAAICCNACAFDKLETKGHSEGCSAYTTTEP